MSFGENTNTSPFEIIEARSAQHKASENQRRHSDALAKAHSDLADAEYLYSRALTDRIKQLHGEGMAITTCERVAKGEESIAVLRKNRNEKKGELAKAEKESFRISADRRALDGLVEWSMRRDLRTDAPPLHWGRPEGAGVPAGVDPKTGELKAA